MRVFAKRIGVQTDFFDHPQRLAGAVVVIGADVVDAHRLDQNLADSEARVQAGVGVLKDDLDAAAVLAHLRCVQLREVFALKHDAAGCRVGQARQHHAHRGFAGAGFAHHAQRAAFVQREIGPFHGAEHAAFEKASFKRIVFAQAFDFNQRCATGWFAHALFVADRALVHDVVNHREAARADVQARATGQKGLGVGVLGCVENLADLAFLAHLAAAHHHNFIRYFTDQAQVVADEQHAHLLALLQAGHQVHDLPLNGDIQRRGGLVRYQQFGLTRNRHRNHHALLLPARELERVRLQALFRVRDTDLGH